MIWMMITPTVPIKTMMTATKRGRQRAKKKRVCCKNGGGVKMNLMVSMMMRMRTS